MNKILCFMFAVFLFTSCSKVNVIDETIEEEKEEQTTPENVEDWKDGGSENIEVHPD